MSILTKMLKMDAVYWEPTGSRDRNGNMICKDPVQIKCRWEDVSEVFVGQSGNNEVSNSLVYCDRDILTGGFLKKGILDDSIESKPLKNQGVFVIRKAEIVPNLRVTRYLRVAVL